MTHPAPAMRSAGFLLAAASFLMLGVLVFHGPIAPDLSEQMDRIADGIMRWRVVHWFAAAALSLYAAAGLVVLTSGSRLVANSWTLIAWAVLAVGALWTVMTAVAETTVVARAAVAGDAETFSSWWAFAEGMATGFAFFALAVAVVAVNEAWSPEPATPPTSAWIGTVAGVASFSGWALGMWFGVPFGNPLWLVSSIVMSLWMLRFGLGLTRR